MKKAALTVLILAAFGGGGYAYYRYTKKAPEPTVMTAAVNRGDIADTVGATGTLQAVTTVQVGTQVSGIVQDLYADFNTLVKKGQVIARLDPSVIQTQIEQARANLIRAEADLERFKVTLDDTRTKLRRAQELSAKSLIPATELDNAQVNVRSAEAQIRSAEASITQSRASVKQNEVNLEHTVITAPIDGLVISRNVDRGQTVAASMQAPTLFVLAADLTKMQVVANLDESDVGRIRPGQDVSFHVDAYPTETFNGKVTQVRLQPIMQQNVVTYATVIECPNPQLKLKPGMTANVNIEIARRNNAVRVPNAALRFRPTNDMFAALGQAPPEQGPREGGRGRGSNPANSTSAAPASGQIAANQPSPSPQRPAADAPVQWNGRGATPPGAAAATSGQGERAGSESSAQGESGGRGRGGFGGGDRAARMQNMTPEQREQMMQRMRARGVDPSSGARGGSDRGGSSSERGGRGRPDRAAPADPAPLASRNPAATTIDALFGPLPILETAGRVWVYKDKQLQPIRLRLGISDGQATELIEGDLEPGTEVVTNVTTGNETRPTIQGGFPPFMGQPGRGFDGRGGFGGGNRGGGGGRGGGGRGGD
jgi:HlyD family secretion protein